MGKNGSNCKEHLPHSGLWREELEERATKYPEASFGSTYGSSDAVIFPKLLQMWKSKFQHRHVMSNQIWYYFILSGSSQFEQSLALFHFISPPKNSFTIKSDTKSQRPYIEWDRLWQRGHKLLYWPENSLALLIVQTSGNHKKICLRIFVLFWK